jgi:hypothetical protein
MAYVVLAIVVGKPVSPILASKMLQGGPSKRPSPICAFRVIPHTLVCLPIRHFTFHVAELIATDLSAGAGNDLTNNDRIIDWYASYVFGTT